MSFTWDDHWLENTKRYDMSHLIGKWPIVIELEAKRNIDQPPNGTDPMLLASTSPPKWQVKGNPSRFLFVITSKTSRNGDLSSTTPFCGQAKRMTKTNVLIFWPLISVAQSRPFDLLVFLCWSIFIQDPKSLTFYFQALWAAESYEPQSRPG